MLTAVVGINWGDEGKGRMVDLLSESYDVVCRYQGGNNAGHTVINGLGRFVLNLLPSGILRSDTANVLGPGMVIDPEHLKNEVEHIRAQGVEIEPRRLIISDRATICMPYHRQLDGLEEDRLGDRKFGSTRRGIAPVYADKYMKKALRMGDVLHTGDLRARLREIAEWKNITLRGYGAETDADRLYDFLMMNAAPFADYIRDTSSYLNAAIDAGKNVMLEAQLGALRDIDFGIYPYTSSSTTLAAYAPIGAGVPARRLDGVVGIMKAYSSCVGEGPFTCEFFGKEAEALREAGGEYGAATGRPRRVGGFDAVASRYGCMLQGPTEIALTKLDVLSGLERIPVCTAYETEGSRTAGFPSGAALAAARPVYEYLPGFDGDISGCRKFSELPGAAQEYVHWIQSAVGCKIEYVSVGADRDQYIRL